LAADPPPGLADAGSELLDAVRSELLMDDEWVVSGERELLWWGAAQPLRITASHPRLFSGDATIKLTASVRLLVDVAADDYAVTGLISALNRMASIGALVWLPQDRELIMHIAHYSYDGNEYFTKDFAPFALLAYTEATARAHSFTESIGGTVATMPHPVSGYRLVPDQLMAVTENLVIPKGHSPNAWPNAELRALQQDFRNRNYVANASENEFTVEFPFLRAGDPRTSQNTTALFQLMILVHPGYGTGLVAILRLPIRYESAEACVLANQLNILEFGTRTGMSAFGSWCVDWDNSSLAHVSFIPNLYARPGGRIASAVHAASYRADWAAHQLLGH